VKERDAFLIAAAIAIPAAICLVAWFFYVLFSIVDGMI